MPASTPFRRPAARSTPWRRLPPQRLAALFLIHGLVLGLAACGDADPGRDSTTPRALEGPARLSSANPLELGLELAGEGLLELRARATSSGRLQLSAALVETAGGRPTGAPLSTAQSVTAGEPLALRLALPAPGLERYRVRVDWDGSAPLVLESMVLHERTPPLRRPVIWINVDTLAARHTSLYGYARDTTPRLDELARESVVFERCRTNAPWTLPSTISQLTGVLPQAFLTPQEEWDSEDDATHPAGSRWQLPAARWTLAEALQAAGYATAAFIDNPYLDPGYGVAQGFELWDMESAAVTRTDPHGGLAHMTPRVLEWLDARAPDAPYFLFLQPFDPHGPYVPAPEHAQRFADDGHTAGLGDAPVARRGAPRGAVVQSYARHAPGADPAQAPPERIPVGPLVDAYDRSIRTLDDALGALLDALRARGSLDHALLIVTSDHGENTVGHGAYFEHKEPWEDVLHVPLVIRPPGGADVARRVDANVQAVDLTPTVLDAAGLPHERPYLHGRSLLPALEGAALPARDHYAYSEVHDTLVLVRGGTKLHLRRPRPGDPIALLSLPEALELRSRILGDLVPDTSDLALLERRLREHAEGETLLAEWRALRATLLEPRRLLYDLELDPGETRDRYATRPEEASALEASGRAREAAAEGAAADAPRDGGAGFAPDAALRSVLEDLGYGG